MKSRTQDIASISEEGFKEGSKRRVNGRIGRYIPMGNGPVEKMQVSLADFGVTYSRETPTLGNTTPTLGGTLND